MRKSDFTPEQLAALGTCYTVTQIAKLYTVSHLAITKAIEQGKLKAVSWANTGHLIFADDLADWLHIKQQDLARVPVQVRQRAEMTSK